MGSAAWTVKPVTLRCNMQNQNIKPYLIDRRISATSHSEIVSKKTQQIIKSDFLKK